MKRYDDIQHLADQFLDGCTSLAEERELERFFASHQADIHSMPEQLQIVAEMMDGFAIAAPAKPALPAWRRWRWAAVSAAAACIAAVLAINLWPSKDAPSPIAEAIPVLKITVKQQSLPSLETTNDEPKAIAYANVVSRPVAPVIEVAPQDTTPVSIPIPMVVDDGLQALVAECELAVLEEKFQQYKTSVTYVKI